MKLFCEKPFGFVPARAGFFICINTRYCKVTSFWNSKKWGS